MTNINDNKELVVNLFLAGAECVSKDSEAAREYLLSQDMNPDRLVTEGLKRIKQLQLAVNAKATQLEMEASKSVKERAMAWVDDLLRSKNFSIADLVRQEELTLSFRNLESMDEQDIRDTLIRHFMLKFINDEKSSK
jgi:hypothetical protein